MNASETKYLLVDEETVVKKNLTPQPNILCKENAYETGCFYEHVIWTTLQGLLVTRTKNDLQRSIGEHFYLDCIFSMARF